MSISFNVSPMPKPVRFVLGCWDFDRDPISLDTTAWPVANDAARTHAGACEVCAVNGGPNVRPEYPIAEVNLNVANAAVVVRALGYLEDGPTGEQPMGSGMVSAQDFLDRTVAAARRHSARLQPVGAAGAPSVPFAYREERLLDRLEELRSIGQYALEHDLEVFWG